MPATYTPLATTTLGSATSTISFTGLSSSYTDLRIVIFCIDTSSYSNLQMRFNSDTGTNYSTTYLNGNGGIPGTSTYTSRGWIDAINWTAGVSLTPAMIIIDVMSYNAAVHKNALLQQAMDRNGASASAISIGRWMNTAAITRIDFTLSGGNFGANTQATLYGIVRA